MAELTITKKTAKTWLHEPSDELQFIIGKFTFSIDGNDFQIVELGQAKRNKYNFADITVIDETTSTTYDNFASIVELSTTLETLGYPAFLRDGEVSGVASVNGLTGIVTIDGTNINVTNPVTATETTLNEALEDINDNVGSVPDLQAVTDVGATTTNPIIVQDTAIFNTEIVNDGNSIFAKDITSGNYIFFIGGGTELQLACYNGTDTQQVQQISFDISGDLGQLFLLPNKPTGNYTLATTDDITGGGYTVVSSNTNASNDTNYTVVANATFTDPSPTEGKGYVVYVRNGTATIGGTGYAVGSLVFRVFHSGSWSTREYKSNLTLDTTPTDGSTNAIESNGVFDALALKTNANRFISQTKTSITGTSSESNICSFKIDGGAYASTDGFKFDFTQYKGTTASTITYRAYIGTTSGARTNQILASAITGANRTGDVTRRYYIDGGNLDCGVPFTSNAQSGLSGFGSVNTPVSVNMANDLWITITAQGQTSGETVGILGASITPLK